MCRIANQGYFVPVGPWITLHGHHRTGWVFEKVLSQVFNFLTDIGEIRFKELLGFFFCGDVFKRHVSLKRQKEGTGKTAI